MPRQEDFARLAPSIIEAFEAVLAGSHPVEQLGQAGWLEAEDEEHVQREVERKLYQPRLPNAGEQERDWVRRLQRHAADAELVTGVRHLCRQYAVEFGKLLPAQEFVKRADGQYLTLPGAYYTRKRPLTKKTSPLFGALIELKSDAVEARHWDRAWLAEFLLQGPCRSMRRT